MAGWTVRGRSTCSKIRPNRSSKRRGTKRKSLSSDLPDPPKYLPAANIVEWPSSKPLYRVHNVAFGATEFNPGTGLGRFHPLRAANGAPIPTIYGASTPDGALSET